jgi:hypothetical protein
MPEHREINSSAIKDYWIPKFTELNNSTPGILPLSFSKIQQGINCPARMKFKYLTPKSEMDKYRKPDFTAPPVSPTSGIAIGNFLHRVLENCVIKCNLYGWSKEVLDFDLVWNNLIKAGGLTLSEYNVVQQYRKETEDIMDLLAHLKMKYNFTYYPEMQCETNLHGLLYTSVVNKHKFNTMKIDLVGVNEELQKAVIIDYKSYKYNGNGKKVELSKDTDTEVYSQLLYYAGHIMDFFNVPECELCVGDILSGKIIKLDSCSQQNGYKKAEEAIINMLEQFFVIVQSNQIQEGDFKLHKYCSYCEFHELCPKYSDSL